LKEGKKNLLLPSHWQILKLSFISSLIHLLIYLAESIKAKTDKATVTSIITQSVISEPNSYHESVVSRTLKDDSN
jgi:hypothetical protein